MSEALEDELEELRAKADGMGLAVNHTYALLRDILIAGKAEDLVAVRKALDELKPFLPGLRSPHR